MEPRRDMWIDSALTQEHIPESISEGSTLQLDRLDEQWYDERFVSPLYIRKHLIQRQEFFNAFIGNHETQQLFVEGPPGSGKTVFYSLLVRMYAKTQQKKVLYVAYRHGNICPIIVFDCDSVKRIRKFPTSCKLYDYVEELLERDQQQYDLVLYDGVRQSIRDSYSVTALFKGRDSGISKVVFVTSLAFRIKDGDTQPARLSILGRKRNSLRRCVASTKQASCLNPYSKILRSLQRLVLFQIKTKKRKKSVTVPQ